jgi:predicted DNA-binding transcriptional regulator AlpA
MLGTNRPSFSGDYSTTLIHTKEAPIAAASVAFSNLKCVGINNWPTLKRRVQQDNFPPGRYVGKNTRVWDEAEVRAWWDSRPKAGPPPEKVKPAPSAATEGSGREEIDQHPRFSDSDDSAQLLLRGGGA